MKVSGILITGTEEEWKGTVTGIVMKENSKITNLTVKVYIPG